MRPPAGKADGANIGPENLDCSHPREEYSKLDKHDDGGGEEKEIFMGFGNVGVRYGNCVNV